MSSLGLQHQQAERCSGWRVGLTTHGSLDRNRAPLISYLFSALHRKTLTNAPPIPKPAPHESDGLDYRFMSLSRSVSVSSDEFGSYLAIFQSTPACFPFNWLTAPLETSGPVAQWIRHRPTEPGIASSSPAGVNKFRWKY